MKRLPAVILMLAVAFGLEGCAANKSASVGSEVASATRTAADTVAVTDIPVLEDTDFGGVYIDMTIDEFHDAGFTYGDAVDVRFSNGYELNGIPYFSGYYVRMGNPLVVAYPGYPHVKVCINFGDPLWETSGVQDGDTATVTLAEAGAYAVQQAALSVAYTDNRDDYESDIIFANFRSLSGGSIKEGAVYRSASPVDNEYNRAAYVEELMADAGVAFVLNLSDNEEEIDAFLEEDGAAGIDMSYFTTLREAGCVKAIDLNANFTADEFVEKLAAGLAEMSTHDGPYLVHCIEGKDRTGFVCILLEALAGASYDEMQADYMETYSNYYPITKESNPERYQAISDLMFDEMMEFLAGVDEGANLSTIDFEQSARDYLVAGGMTEAQIDTLVERICE